MAAQFPDVTSSPIFFDVIFFLLSSLATGPSFMSISSQILELWQFSHITDWPEIRKLVTPPSEFCPMSWDCSELGITKFGANVSNKMWLTAAKCQGYRFYCFWVIQGKTTGGGGKITFPPTTIEIRVKYWVVSKTLQSPKRIAKFGWKYLICQTMLLAKLKYV